MYISYYTSNPCQFNAIYVASKLQCYKPFNYLRTGLHLQTLDFLYLQTQDFLCLQTETLINKQTPFTYRGTHLGSKQVKGHSQILRAW